VKKNWYRKKTALGEAGISPEQGETGTADTDHPGGVESKAECLEGTTRQD
jgi:hypothetical protein